MIVRQQFIDWMESKGVYKDINIATYIERYLQFIDFDPFQIKDDYSDIGLVKQQLTAAAKELEQNADFKAFNFGSQKGVPSALMGKENYFKFLDTLLVEAEILKFSPYFNIAGVWDYQKVSDTKYDSSTKEAEWYYSTRMKLYYLITLLSARLGEEFKLVYHEQPNAQKGRGKINFKDYILAGFVPKDKNIGDDLFIKISFSNLKNKPLFAVDLDMNFRKGTGRFNAKRKEIYNNSLIEWEINDSFPDNWEALLQLIAPEINKLNQQFKKMLQNSPTSKTATMTQQPLNQILYGPPGTGKTYNTINKALLILGENIEGKSRDAIKKLFDEKVKEQQIMFTTFHQSMSYEDFIEGIKPETKKEQVIYKIEDGIFKQIVKNAMIDFIDKTESNSDDSFDDLYQKFVASILPEKGKRESTFATKTGIGMMLVDANENSIMVKYVWSDYKKESEGQHTFSVTKEKIKLALLEGIVPANIKNLKKELHPLVGHIHCELFAVYKSFYDFVIANKGEIETVHFEYADLTFEEVKEQFDLLDNNEIKDKEVKPFVIIIDEINRGNVSQIFGELITLIEDDKRLGNAEALEIMLPYSKKKFGIPSNVYLLGTMNTADRSVEGLDTALRRRFCFEEMLPKANLVSPSAMYCRLLWKYKDVDWSSKEFVKRETELFDLLGVSEELKKERVEIWKQMIAQNKTEDLGYFEKYYYSGIDLCALLNKINVRLEILISRDHTIGHSYFLAVNSIHDLKLAFQNKIIPLLQEYFFGDYGKIGLVLGKDFFETVEENDEDIFSDFYDYDASELAQRPIYDLKNIAKFSDIQMRDAITSLLK